MKTNFKLISFSILIFLLFSSCSKKSKIEVFIEKDQSQDQAFNGPYETEVYMSPHQGQLAFNKIYEMIKEAKDYIHLTLYSWSDVKLFEALKHTLKKDYPPKVKIVLHKNLYKKQKGKNTSLIKRVTKLENLGAIVKFSKKKMHEKFLIVDDRILMNGSANMSSGPLSRYSENFIFYTKKLKGHSPVAELIKQFKHEFSILFNSASDIITLNEDNSTELFDYLQISEQGKIENKKNHESDLFLVSSSMNFSLKRNKVESINYNEGQFLNFVLKKNEQKKVWTVRNQIINEINKAEHSIFVCLNHLTLSAVKDALMNAVKRGVDVKWLVDNNEFRDISQNKINHKSKEQTPFFVKEYKEYFNTDKAPVRVKWYSLAPNPRYALLNHHKFILIDYKTKSPILLSGSSNISKTAEFSQFDNMVIHKGLKYKNLFKSFYQEFHHLWMQNRNEFDLPKSKILEKFKALNQTFYLAIHKRTPLSLTWNEVIKLREELFTMAQGLKVKLSAFRHCGYYHIDERKFYNFNSSKKVYKECLKRY